MEDDLNFLLNYINEFNKNVRKPKKKLKMEDNLRKYGR
jgi:hypothetical protein